MKIIHWNVGYNAKMSSTYEELKKYTNGTFIYVLLEIIPQKKDELIDLFKGKVNYAYSLDYRRPGRFDGKDRKLGILMLTSTDILIKDSGVFDRTLFPDRTLWARLCTGGRNVNVAGFHSITGCDHKKSKSTNFLSMAEAIDEFRPDILTIDANEPAVDHYEIKKMSFYDKNGRGARTFFEEIVDIGLVDAYSIDYDIDRYEVGKPLAVSHVVAGNRGKRRYDFIMLRRDMFQTENVTYDYDRAVELTADHAIVSADCKMQ